MTLSVNPIDTANGMRELELATWTSLQSDSPLRASRQITLSVNVDIELNFLCFFVKEWSRPANIPFDPIQLCVADMS